MSGIDRPGQLAALIRAQIAAARPAAPLQHGTPGQRKAASPAAPAETPAPGGSDLPPQASPVLLERIRALQPEDPQRRRKAFRLFLETVLLQELGPHLANDSSFDPLVERVLQQMESDEELLAAIEEAAEVLLAGARHAPGG